MSKTLETQIEEFVAKRDHVSFVELERFAKEHDVVTNGEVALHLPDRPNSIMWVGLSQPFADTLVKLMNEKRIFPHGAPWLVYLIDGRMLNLPIAKRLHPTKDYKKERWVPVCFRTVPIE